MRTTYKRYSLAGGPFGKTDNSEGIIENAANAKESNVNESSLNKQGVFVSDWSIFETSSRSQPLNNNFVADWHD